MKEAMDLGLIYAVIFPVLTGALKGSEQSAAFNYTSNKVLISCDISMAPKFFLDGEPQDTVINLEHSQQNKINLVLPCRAYGCPLPRYTWYRNGRDITESATPMKNGEFGFKVRAGDGISKEGVKYYCVATSYFNGQPAGIKSREAIVMYAYTDYVVTAPTVSNILAMARGSLYLKCKIPTSNPPLKVVTWLDGTGSELIDNETYYDSLIEYDEGGKYLFIEMMDAYYFNLNNFFCKVSNASGPPFLSRVGYKVVDDLRFQELAVYDHEEEFFGLTGETVTFRYVAHFKVNQPYRGTGIHLQCRHPVIEFFYSDNGEVTFSVPPADYANYSMEFSCIQESLNENRLDPVVFKLTVLKLPTVEISSPNEDVVVKYEADSLKLVCDGSALPPPTIVWYHNGARITKSTPDIKVNGKSLYIPKLSRSHFGIFQCAVITIHKGKSHEAHRMWFLRIAENLLDEHQVEFRRSVIVFFLLTPAVTWTALFIIFKLIEGVLCCVTCSRSNKKRHISDKDHCIAGQRDNQDMSAAQMTDVDDEEVVSRSRAEGRKKRRKRRRSSST